MSTMPESVVLRQVTEDNAAEIAARARGVNLGDPAAEAGLNAFLRQVRAGKRIFVLDWEGSKVPRGVEIDGQEIAWTQNGMVTSTDRKHIGTYNRTIEFGGESGQHHQMVIYV